MPKQISFIHAADLHLDSPFKGLATAPEQVFQDIQASTFEALDRLVEVAIDKDVDFVLLVGDLFDNDSQSLKAQIRLRRAFEKLKNEGIHVFISYGNHDFIQGNIHSVSYPDNVFIFPTEQVSHFTYYKDNHPMAQIYGFSYERRAIRENKTIEYKIQNDEVPFHIATLHGSIKNNQEHDVYAPFQVSDLLRENFHYWALGHIHKRNILRKDPPVVYPGNTQGRHRNETGEKGCYYVKLTETTEELTFIPLHAIEFASTTLELGKYNEIHEVEEAIRKKLETYEAFTPTLLDLTLKNIDHLNWIDYHNMIDLIDFIHETTTDQRNWQYIFSLSIQNNIQQEAIVGDHFIGKLTEQFEQVNLSNILNDLYHHRQARKYLFPLTIDEKNFIKEDAKQLLLNKLLNKD